MHFFLCVRIEDFYVRDLVRREPALATDALVVIEGGKVLEASDDARLRGVGPGMPKSQAKALLQGGRFVERERDDFTMAQRAWLDRLIPFSDAIEPADQHEAFIDLSRHPRPEDIASLALAAVAENNPRTASGAGCSKWLSRLSVDQKEKGAVHEPKKFLCELPVTLLSPANQKAIDKLLGLGYSTIGQLQEVPLTVLYRQFGAEGQLIHQAANGRFFDPVKALYPEQSMGSYIAFEGGTESSEVLELGFIELAKELGGRLASEERETAEAFLHIEHEKGVNTRNRTFAKAISDERTLLCALRLMLSKLPEEPVYGLRVTLPRLKRARRVQTGLFGQRTDEVVRLQKALLRVNTVFGQSTVMLASDFEIPRRVRVLKEMGRVVGWQ